MLFDVVSDIMETVIHHELADCGRLAAGTQLQRS